jgi:DNA-binding IclR family transcriptional regulator
MSAAVADMVMAQGGDMVIAQCEDTSIVARAFLLLAAFRSEPVLGISELARRTGLPRTTVHRLANQLYAEGALSRVGTKFRIGAALFELGNLHYPQRLRDTLQPLLDDLRRVSTCDVSLLELVGDDVVVIAASRAHTAEIGHLGQRIPAHACAGGQVLLAAEGRRVTGRLRVLTTSTLADGRHLHLRLAEVRSAALAVEHGEAEVGRSGIGVSVANRHGRILAALMLMGPTGRFDVPVLTNTVLNFSRALTAAGQKAAIGFFASARPRSEPAAPVMGFAVTG